MKLSAVVKARLSDDFSLDVAFDAMPGITMVFGGSGSGKTTLLNCLAGLRRADAGRVQIGDLVAFDSKERIDVHTRHRRVGYVFQDLALFPHLTVEQNLEFGIAHLERDQRAKRVGSTSETLRIRHLLDRRPSEISGGERQRTALARSLVTDPRLLLLDEPLSGLDYVTQSRIIEDLRVWNAARGIPVLYVTHSHREVFALGERVIVLEAGRLIAQGSPQEVLDAPADEPLAQLAGFQNFFDATIESVRPDWGTMHCRLESGDAELEVPLARAEPGTIVRIAVRAGDIMVATQPPRGLSARNILSGTITSIQREGATVMLMVAAGGDFQVHLTPGAQESLRLFAGQMVWLVIKTHSWRLVARKV